MPRPVKTFEKFVGQRRWVKVLKRHIVGTRATGQALPHMLLLGPPGSGKTSFGQATATAMGVRAIKIEASRDMRVEGLYTKILELESHDLLLVDEAHRMPPEVQDGLLGPTGEERRIRRAREGKQGQGNGDEYVSVADFTLIIATDQPGCLREALLSRLALHIALDPYGLSEMRAIAKAICDEKCLSISTQALTVIARAGKGIPRKAAHLVDLLASYACNRPQQLTKSEVEEFLLDHGIDPETLLDSIERRYLAALHARSNPACLRLLARVIGVDEEFCARHLEPSLVRDGFAEVVNRGRVLTTRGTETATSLASRFPSENLSSLAMDEGDDDWVDNSQRPRDNPAEGQSTKETRA